MDFEYFFKYFFNYKTTVVRLTFSIALLLAIGADNVSSFEELAIAVGGAIMGSVVSEIVIKALIYIVFSDKK